MNRRLPSILVAACCCLVAVAAVLVYTARQAPSGRPAPPSAHRAVQGRKTTKQTLLPMSLSPSEPRHLVIPKLQLQAPVASVGQNDKGEMASPDSASVVGWYRLGYLPGSIGNAVLAAHYMHTSGKGAFYALEKLSPGDTVQLHTAESIQTYAVTESKVLADTESELTQVFGASKHANLNLITCTGTWNDSTKRYSNRLVVFSRFQREQPLPPKTPAS